MKAFDQIEIEALQVGEMACKYQTESGKIGGGEMGRDVPSTPRSRKTIKQWGYRVSLGESKKGSGSRRGALSTPGKK